MVYAVAGGMLSEYPTLTVDGIRAAAAQRDDGRFHAGTAADSLAEVEQQAEDTPEVPPPLLASPIGR